MALPYSSHTEVCVHVCVCLEGGGVKDLEGGSTYRKTLYNNIDF